MTLALAFWVVLYVLRLHGLEIPDWAWFVPVFTAVLTMDESERNSR